MRMILVQLLTTLSISLVLLPFGRHLAVSALIGGGIATLTNWMVANKIFVPYRAQQPGQVVARFYSAEFQKILLTALLFGLAVVYVAPLNPVVMFGMYLVAYFVPTIFTCRVVD
jgi:ATP synthase protein I